MLQYAEYGTLIILIICSIIALAVVLERLLAYKKTAAQAKTFRGALKPLLEAGDEEQIKAACDKSKAPLASVLAPIWEAETKLRPEQTSMLLRQSLEDEADRLRKFLSVLATLAGTAPFIGLFGTVLGIIHTFQSIAQKGFGGPAVVSAGISAALIATAAGLAVAIPSVIFYNVFTRKVNQTVKQTENEATQILIMLGQL